MDTKPTCPICPGDRKLAKNGFNASSGTQRYRCTAKGCTYSLSDSPHTQGRPTKWDKAMTDAERQAEYRARQDEKRPIETINLEETPMTYPPATAHETSVGYLKTEKSNIPEENNK